MLQNIWSLSSKRTGKSQIWFTFAGVISQNCVILVNGGEQEEKKFPNTVIVSSAIAQRPSQQWPVSMQALIFSSKALVLRKFGSTNHTLNSIDTRNDTNFFLFYSSNPPQKKLRSLKCWSNLQFGPTLSHRFQLHSVSNRKLVAVSNSQLVNAISFDWI